jgi:hypothetical protein
MLTRTRVAHLSCSLWLAWCAVSCKSEHPEREHASQLDVIRIANNIADGAHLADELGYFAARHIRIEWTGKQAHGPAAIVSLIAGQTMQQARSAPR